MTGFIASSIKHCFGATSSIAAIPLDDENKAMLEANDVAQKISTALAAAEARGYSAAEVARECKVTPQAVNGWKTTGRIAKKHIPTIARLSGFPAEWFLTLGDTPPSSVEPEMETSKKNFLRRLSDIYKEYETLPPSEKELVDEALQQQAELRRLLKGGDE